MVGLVHDEVVLLVPEEHAGRAAGWLTEIMEGVGDVVVNGDALSEKRPAGSSAATDSAARHLAPN
jgi:hypothetical protein